MHARGDQKTSLGIKSFLTYHLPLIEIALLTELELTKQSRLAGQGAPKIHLSPSPHSGMARAHYYTEHASFFPFFLPLAFLLPSFLLLRVFFDHSPHYHIKLFYCIYLVCVCYSAPVEETDRSWFSPPFMWVPQVTKVGTKSLHLVWFSS